MSGGAGAGAIHAHNTGFDLIGPDAHKDHKHTRDRVLEKHPDITWYPTTCSPLRLLPHEHGLEHVALLNEDTNAPVACVDTGLTLFATDVDEEGFLSGPEFGYNYQRIGDQMKMFRERDGAMVFGDYGQTAMEPIATNGMKPSLEILYYYLTMIEEAELEYPWYISIWAQEIAREVGRPVATQDEARALYNIT